MVGGRSLLTHDVPQAIQNISFHNITDFLEGPKNKYRTQNQDSKDCKDDKDHTIKNSWYNFCFTLVFLCYVYLQTYTFLALTSSVFWGKVQHGLNLISAEATKCLN